MMLILLNVLDELMYLMGNKEELKLNRTLVDFLVETKQENK